MGFFAARGAGLRAHLSQTSARDTMRPLTPATIAAPSARYTERALLLAGVRIIRTSRKLGLAADGTVPDSVAEPAAIRSAIIRAIVAEGGMGVEDIWYILAWLTERADSLAFKASRSALH
jgi:hypothetical protein